jgi:hypothetical protein
MYYISTMNIGAIFAGNYSNTDFLMIPAMPGATVTVLALRYYPTGPALFAGSAIACNVPSAAWLAINKGNNSNLVDDAVGVVTDIDLMPFVINASAPVANYTVYLIENQGNTGIYVRATVRTYTLPNGTQVPLADTWEAYIPPGGSAYLYSWTAPVRPGDSYLSSPIIYVYNNLSSFCSGTGWVASTNNTASSATFVWNGVSLILSSTGTPSGAANLAALAPTAEQAFSSYASILSSFFQSTQSSTSTQSTQSSTSPTVMTNPTSYTVAVSVPLTNFQTYSSSEVSAAITNVGTIQVSPTPSTPLSPAQVLQSPGPQLSGISGSPVSPTIGTVAAATIGIGWAASRRDVPTALIFMGVAISIFNILFSLLYGAAGYFLLAVAAALIAIGFALREQMM